MGNFLRMKYPMTSKYLSRVNEYQRTWSVEIVTNAAPMRYLFLLWIPQLTRSIHRLQAHNIQQSATAPFSTYLVPIIITKYRYRKTAIQSEWGASSQGLQSESRQVCMTLYKARTPSIKKVIPKVIAKRGWAWDSYFTLRVLRWSKAQESPSIVLVIFCYSRIKLINEQISTIFINIGINRIVGLVLQSIQSESAIIFDYLMGKRQKQQLKKDEKQNRKKDRQIRKKYRKQARGEAFKKTATYIKFFSDFDKEISQLGIQLRDVGGDGNCLFRSIADQVDGDESLHRIYREEACRHMRENSDFYQLFIDEDEDGTIDQYIKEMLKDGEWGGNLELQAFSSCFNMNIVVHRKQLQETIIEPMNVNIDHHKNSKRFAIHVAYFQEEDFEHYTSIRKVGDQTKDPGMLALQKMPQYLDLNANPGGDVDKKKGKKKAKWEDDEEERLIVEQMAAMGIEYHPDDNYSDYEEKKPEEEEQKQEVEVPQQIEQPYPNYPRNKKCKCGSKETYKNCCYKNYQKMKSMIYESMYG